MFRNILVTMVPVNNCMNLSESTASLLSYVPYVLSCPTFLVSHVTRALRTLLLHVFRVLCALESYLPHGLRALLAYVPRALRALAPHVPRALHALEPCVPRAFLSTLVYDLRASRRMCSRAYTLSCLMCLVPCVSRIVLVSHVCSALRVLELLCLCSNSPCYYYYYYYYYYYSLLILGKCKCKIIQIELKINI